MYASCVVLTQRTSFFVLSASSSGSLTFTCVLFTGPICYKASRVSMGISPCLISAINSRIVTPQTLVKHTPTKIIKTSISLQVEENQEAVYQLNVRLHLDLRKRAKVAAAMNGMTLQDWCAREIEESAEQTWVL